MRHCRRNDHKKMTKHRIIFFFYIGYYGRQIPLPVKNNIEFSQYQDVFGQIRSIHIVCKSSRFPVCQICCGKEIAVQKTDCPECIQACIPAQRAFHETSGMRPLGKTASKKFNNDTVMLWILSVDKYMMNLLKSMKIRQEQHG